MFMFLDYVPISSIAQKSRKQCTFFMLREAVEISISCKHSFQLQFYLIFPSSHDLAIRGSPYLNFSIEHVDGMDLLSISHKRKQVSLHLWKIENIMQPKIRKSRQFELDGSNFLGLNLDLYAKYTNPSTLSFRSSKKSFLKIMWKVALVSSNHVYLLEANEALNRTLCTPILQRGTIECVDSSALIDSKALSFVSIYSLFFQIFYHGIMHVYTTCPLFSQRT